MTLLEISELMGHSATAVQRYYARGKAAPARLAAPGGGDSSDAAAAEWRLAAALGRLAADRAALELQAWRDYQGSTVRSASSLALAMFAHAGLDLDAAVRRLGPEGARPDWLVGLGFAGRARKARWPGRRHDVDLRAADERERFLHSGHVLRGPGEPGGIALGIRLSPFGLEVAFVLGHLSVRTLADEATVAVDAGLPETVRQGLVGWPLGALVDHPILRDPALVIMDADALAWPLRPGAWAMTVRAPRVPWRVPWARGRA